MMQEETAHITIKAHGDTVQAAAVPGQTLLGVLQAHRILGDMPCRGAGTCGACRVLVRTDGGLRSRLACQVRVEDGMRVVVSRPAGMDVAESGRWGYERLLGRYRIDGAKDARSCGVAVDIGTTTIVMHLHSLATGHRLATVACVNPQTVFGADVASRITASVEGGLAKMREMLMAALNGLLDTVCGQAGISRGWVRRAALAGNTVMEHIAAGLAPDSMGVAPFAPLSLFGTDIDLPELSCSAYFAPAASAFVGGDICAGLLACSVRDIREPSLFVDIGTNGEMVLAVDGRLLCCATAAGSAFEGAGITFGMPASEGAVSEVRIGADGLQLGTIGGGVPCGICGSGLVDALAALRRLGAVDASGLIASREQAGGLASDLVDERQGIRVCYLDRASDLYLTQHDIRALQLAKGAVAAGIETLCAHAGIVPGDVEQILLAGGFGTCLPVGSACEIGLLAGAGSSRIAVAGNVAGEGASAALLSKDARDELSRIADDCAYLKLSVDPGFNRRFIDNLSL